MDYRASYPVTPNKRLFTLYKPSVGIVKMRNKQKSKVVGVVDVSLVTNMDHKLTLKMVRYVQDLRMNLMLASEVDSKGYVIHHILLMIVGSFQRKSCCGKGRKILQPL